MYIYNVTVNIESAVHDQWVSWMREFHIPEMISTGKFIQATLSRVLIDEETGGITYSVQYRCLNREVLEAYYLEDAPRMRLQVQKKFPDRFVAFRTEMQIIDEHVTENPSATAYLFTYGTLSDKAVQTELFSRNLSGTRDQLKGFRIADFKVAGCYPTIEVSDDRDAFVNGEVHLINKKDLGIADTYEGVAYKRIKVGLVSGKKAWVYLSVAEINQP
jgi:gamma-glutamylcyclotransferase (GGCT)/AIG2-like uncharacterized protein YtfP